MPNNFPASFVVFESDSDGRLLAFDPETTLHESAPPPEMHAPVEKLCELAIHYSRGHGVGMVSVSDLGRWLGRNRADWADYNIDILETILFLEHSACYRVWLEVSRSELVVVTMGGLEVVLATPEGRVKVDEPLRAQVRERLEPRIREIWVSEIGNAPTMGQPSQ